MLIDDLYFYLEFNEGEIALNCNEPQQYVYSTTGAIVCTDRNEKKTVAGRFHLYYVDVGAALNAGESIYDVFDSYAETFDYYGAIFNPRTLDLTSKLRKLFKNSSGWGSVLILNRLEILPKFRRHKLGLLTMRRLIERFGAGTCVVAIKPFPLQSEVAHHYDEKWHARLELQALPQDFEHATAKLRAYYSQLGFKAMKGTPFMFFMTEDSLPKLDHER